MTLNVLTHQKDILSAYDVILKSTSCNHWVILEYENNSNIIKVADTGDGGMEELSTSFTAGRLQYGIGAVRWGASASAKIVLIQWQGEGVPSSRLVTTANHGSELKRFLRGIHVILIARNEEDVDMESILRVVSRLPGVNETVPTLTEISEFTQPKAVGTTYQPVKPKNEIDTVSREKFWKEVRAQENDRIAEERKREREKNEMALRERSELNERIHAQLCSEEKAKKVDETSSSTIYEKDIIRANDLVQVKGTLCEKVSNESQLFIVESPKTLQVIREQTAEKASGCTSTNEGNADIIEENDVLENKSQQRRSEQEVGLKSSVIYQTDENFIREDTLQKTESEVIGVMEDTKSSHGRSAIALWDYQAADETEISFNPDDIITDVDQIDEGWWHGRAPDGKYGLFPANYVSLL
ncbi:Variant SH3 domain containing protein [Brugia malayi]|uniref:Bm4914 n=2 Tax=Brugia malayi TaxID=6279 RepID=A0A0H5S4T4_BRUMA|nr:Variant SH3 domain containing protein [Brugia malayi]CRZ23619.1 Bm4914 [Brugia malayi]VIO90252.1 Variant SH3 domain containing protein [Brugia malayi]